MAQEVATLPESLRSHYPDFAVDFLATVFPDCGTGRLQVAEKKNLAHFIDRAGTDGDSICIQTPQDLEESLLSPGTDLRVHAVLEAMAAEAAILEMTAPPNIVSLGSLAKGFSDLGGLIQCSQCARTLLACSKDSHAALCRGEVESTTGINSTATRSKQLGGMADSSEQSNGDTAKRKRTNGVKNGGKKKSRLSKGSSLIVEPTPNGNGGGHHAFLPKAIPTSPPLRAPDANRRPRSGVSRRPRQYLNFVPGKELCQPLEINRNNSSEQDQLCVAGPQLNGNKPNGYHLERTLPPIRTKVPEVQVPQGTMPMNTTPATHLSLPAHQNNSAMYDFRHYGPAVERYLTSRMTAEQRLRYDSMSQAQRQQYVSDVYKAKILPKILEQKRQLGMQLAEEQQQQQQIPQMKQATAVQVIQQPVDQQQLLNAYWARQQQQVPFAPQVLRPAVPQNGGMQAFFVNNGMIPVENLQPGMNSVASNAAQSMLLQMAGGRRPVSAGKKGK